MTHRLKTTAVDAALCLLSASLLAMPWFGITSLTLLFAFVPLLFVQRRHAGRHFWLAAMFTFALFNLFTISWVAKAAVIGAVAATVAYTLYFGSVAALYNAVCKRAPKSLAYTLLVSCWVAAERLYLNGEISFPWLNLGGGLATDHILVQWYEYTGSLGGTLWILIVNLLLFEAISKTVDDRKFVPSRWIAPLLWIAVPVIWSLAIYASYDEGDEKVAVTMLQPNIDPYKDKFGGMTQNAQLDRLVEMVRRAPADSRFIVAPETALDDNYWIGSIEGTHMVDTLRRTLAETHPGASVVLGINTFRGYHKMMYDAPPTTTARTLPGRDYWWDAYNSALCIDTTETLQLYHKSKLVIGVEMIPYHEYFAFLNKLSVDLGGISGMLATQEESTCFHNRDLETGCAICYESVYGEYFASFVEKGAKVMFVITNDGWWGDTPGYRQHLRFSRLRAIETRRSIGRSANTGISALINERGDITAQTLWDEECMLSGELTLNDRTTLFVRYGDITGRASTGVFLLSLLYFFAYRRRKKDYIV